ncbi:hypothetical protein AMTR_s00105p00060140 [Amborella trichopoda]|uniref:Transcription elongation factor Eaf N-terminal domain-containing protein n=2 Tax=Amborella trichopoda TaxID=13333 RepID=W1NSF7_AMBTC|nr:hypothetical protein AMTR_s00105p00060140 [Amborella trichopoda]
MANRENREPSTAPLPDKWYDLTLGSSFKEGSTAKFCTLRYEFKPASIDKNQAGSLHKKKDNRVTVEFPNNQLGKPNVKFDGSIEDCKDNEAVLFFDGHSFRLERLHRAVKRLRHVRLPGESSSSATGVNSIGGGAPAPLINKNLLHPVPVAVERIEIGESELPGVKPTTKFNDHINAPNLLTTSPEGLKNSDPEENVDLIFDDSDGKNDKMEAITQDANLNNSNAHNQNDTDDEIADVDLSDDEADKGPNAAEALRAQVYAAEESEGTSSSSSGSSGSGSSGSGSGSGSSSSSDSEGSDDDSVSVGA